MPPSLVPRKAPHACNVDVYLNAARISEISDASTEVVTFGDRQPRCGFAVHRRAVDLVAPPDELDAVIRESEEDDDGGESRARVERRAEEICKELKAKGQRAVKGTSRNLTSAAYSCTSFTRGKLAGGSHS